MTDLNHDDPDGAEDQEDGAAGATGGARLSRIHKAQRAYARLGIPTFPCEPGDKVPIFREGADAATTDLAQIDAWHAQVPDLNIGARPADFGCVAIVAAPVCDPELRGKLGAARSREHESPRGSTHYLFKTDRTFTDGLELARGVKVRSGRGYIILPTSRIEGQGEYRLRPGAIHPAPCPEWLLDRLAQAEEHLAENPRNPDPTDVLSYDEWLAMPDPEMVVEKIVPQESMILVWGDTGCGKTYFLAELAVKIAWRMPVYDKFPVRLPQHSGVVVIFAGEDAAPLVKSRLTALSVKHNRALEGHVFVCGVALPIDENEARKVLIEKLEEIQRRSGRNIDAILNDTLGRSLGQLNPNEADVAQLFTKVMEGLAKQFHCPVICSAHQPKASVNIAGSKIFQNNTPVTPHIEGEFDRNHRLIGFHVTFEPKYRIGQTPEAFYVAAEPVRLPKPVNGNATDIVFHLTEAAAAGGAEDGESRAAQQECETCLEVLRAAGPAGLQRSAWEAGCAARGIKKGNFKNRLNWLVEKGLVLKPKKQRQPYRLTEGATEWRPRGRKVGDLGGDDFGPSPSDYMH